MKNKVLLFACIEQNIGDDLFIQTICNRYPRVEFVISSKAKYGSLEQLPNLKFSKLIKWWLLVISLNPTNRIIKIITRIVEALLTRLVHKYKVAVYIVGNAFKNTKYEGWEQSNWIRKRLSISDDFLLVSTNFGPYDDVRWVDDSRVNFSNMKDVCFRDKESFTLFKELPNVRYAPDAILSLGKLKKKECNDEKIILISVIDCTLKAREKWLNDLGDVYEAKMTEVADHFIQKGYKVILINSNTYQDSPASKRIKEKCQEKNIFIYDYLGNLEEIMDIFCNSSAVVATRLHTIILSWLYDIPVVPIVYDIKVSSMISSYGFEGSNYDISCIGNISAEQIENDLLNYSDGLSDGIFKEANNQFNVLNESIGLL